MESNSVDVENAFLAWMNSLKMPGPKLTSVLQLKDGVQLIKILHKVYLPRLFHQFLETAKNSLSRASTSTPVTTGPSAPPTFRSSMPAWNDTSGGS